MAELTKDQILKAEDIKREKVNVPEWGGHVYITEMSGFMRDHFELQFAGEAKQQSTGNIRAVYVAHCVTDKDGNLLFTADDVKELGRKSAAALDRLFAVAERLNHIYTELEDESKK